MSDAKLGSAEDGREAFGGARGGGWNSCCHNNLMQALNIELVLPRSSPLSFLLQQRSEWALRPSRCNLLERERSEIGPTLRQCKAR